MKKSASSSSSRDTAAAMVLFVIGLDLVVFVVASVAASFGQSVPVTSLSFVAIVNAAAWGFAIFDDGRGL